MDAKPPYFLNGTFDDNANGDIYRQNLKHSLVIRTSTFANNNIDSLAPGGGLCIRGLPIAGLQAIIEIHEFTGNGTSGDGGGIMVSGFENLSNTGNTFTGNHAHNVGYTTYTYRLF